MPKTPTQEAGKTGGCGRKMSLATGILVLLAAVLIAVAVLGAVGPAPLGLKSGFSSASADTADDTGNTARAHPGAPPADDASSDGMFVGGAPERRSVYAALNRLYSTADVDPLITGNLYNFTDGVRNVYAERTSHGDVHGLTEYSSGSPGEVGVDIGPYGLDEYGGREIGYDDGIPAEWRLPSTPVRWFAPAKRDYYGPEGPTPFVDGLYDARQPDHDPLTN